MSLQSGPSKCFSSFEKFSTADIVCCKVLSSEVTIPQSYRIAVFSDVHTSCQRSEAVLQSIDSLKPDMVLCLGDLVDFAPWPKRGYRSRSIARNLHLDEITMGGSPLISSDLSRKAWARGEIKNLCDRMVRNGVTRSQQSVFGEACRGLLSFRFGERQSLLLQFHARTPFAVWMNTSTKAPSLKRTLKQYSSCPGRNVKS